MLQDSGDGLDEAAKKAKAKKQWTIVAAAVATIVAVVLGLTLASGDDKKSEDTFLTTAAPVSNSDEPEEIANAEPLPNVCDVLAAGDVGAIVDRPMTSGPMVAGRGCLYTATDQPNIDLSTPYPPYISQVTLTYNAPEPGLTEEQIADLFETSRQETDVDVPGPAGGEAYSSGGGSATVLDDGVMIICSTSGITRPESIPDVQAMCVAIASLLRTELP